MQNMPPVTQAAIVSKEHDTRAGSNWNNTLYFAAACLLMRAGRPPPAHLSGATHPQSHEKYGPNMPHDQSPAASHVTVGLGVPATDALSRAREQDGNQTANSSI